MPNVMVALPNIGGALCSTPQSLADAQYWNAVQYPKNRQKVAIWAPSHNFVGLYLRN